jgi:hypothetical protein
MIAVTGKFHQFTDFLFFNEYKSLSFVTENQTYIQKAMKWITNIIIIQVPGLYWEQ